MYGEPCSLVSALFRDLLSQFKGTEEGQGARAVNPCFYKLWGFFCNKDSVFLFFKYVIPLPFLHLAIPFSWHMVMKL